MSAGAGGARGPTGPSELGGPSGPSRHGAVRAYWLDVSRVSEGALAALARDLSAEELARAERIRFAEDRAAYVAAHGMLRRGLLEALTETLGDGPGARPRDLDIRAREDGKPELFGEHCRALFFSLSHTRGAAAWAIGAADEVGVDVEAIAGEALALELAPRVLADPERARMDELGTDHFFDLWTLKEAFVKATGEGLRRDLRGVAFDWQGGPALRAAAGLDPAAWGFQHARIEADARVYSLSLCASRAGLGGELDSTIHRVDPSGRLV